MKDSSPFWEGGAISTQYFKIWEANRPHLPAGGIPSTGCLYPEVVLKEYIVFGCQCSKAPRQKISFQKKVWWMKPHKSRRAGAMSGITPHKSETPKPRSLSPVPISMALQPSLPLFFFVIWWGHISPNPKQEGFWTELLAAAGFKLGPGPFLFFHESSKDREAGTGTVSLTVYATKVKSGSSHSPVLLRHKAELKDTRSLLEGFSMRSWGIFRVLHRELYPKTLSHYASVSSESPPYISYDMCPMLALSFSIQLYALDFLSDLPRSPVPSCPLNGLGKQSPLSSLPSRFQAWILLPGWQKQKGTRLSRTGAECSLVAKHSSPSIRSLFLNHKLLDGWPSAIYLASSCFSLSTDRYRGDVWAAWASKTAVQRTA